MAQTVICVFCGSSEGSSPSHMAAAKQLAEVFHENKIALVYGGGTTGLMGEIARNLVALSGPDAVHGIIPKALIKYEQQNQSEPKNNDLVYGKVTIVEDMHARKGLMANEVITGGPGSGFVALTGGFGTLEELMEIATWNQLGIHERGVCVFNVDGFYNHIIDWIRTAVTHGMIRPDNGRIISEAKSAEEVVKALREYTVSKSRLDLDWVNK